jgi:hypothetical protein
MVLQRDFKKLGPGLVPVGERETVQTPGFRIWVNLGRFNESVPDPKSFTVANANNFITRTGFSTAKPSLLVNRRVPFAGDLSILESAAAKFFLQ